jgi:hypothetical protein
MMNRRRIWLGSFAPTTSIDFMAASTINKSGEHGLEFLCFGFFENQERWKRKGWIREDERWEDKEEIWMGLVHGSLVPLARGFL